MSDNNISLLALTRDSRLIAAIERHAAGAGEVSVCPSVADAAVYADAEISQLWIDLDTETGDLLPTACRRVYFYSAMPIASDKLPQGIFIRKPCSDAIISLLMADAAAAITDRAPIEQAPAWLLQMNLIDLRQLCHQIVTQLPKKLGYANASLYLADEATLTLTLAESSAPSSMDLSIATQQQPAHLLAHALRQARPITTSNLAEFCRNAGLRATLLGAGDAPVRALVARLEGPERTQGVLLLHGGNAAGALSAGEERLIFEFIGRSLSHAVAYENARIEARIDGLTGLYNYRWMIESLAREIRRAQRFGQALSIVMVDLDGFKPINDAHGHQAGDAVLRHVAGRIRSVLRHVDSAARIGGDEFLVLLPGTDAEGAANVSEKIRVAVCEHSPMIAQDPVPVGVSLGHAAWQAGWDAYRLLEAADQSMYASKREGRSRFMLRQRQSPAGLVADAALRITPEPRE
jgi:diguanylate cyclase (GGDEF)-like protein